MKALQSVGATLCLMVQAQTTLATLAVSHLSYSSFYGFNPPLQKGWMNLQLEASLTDKLECYKDYGIPSFYGDLPCTPEPEAIFERGHGLAPGWEQNLEIIATRDIIPNMQTGAIRGVFLGDEICCHNVTCWETSLAPVTAKLRSLLGSRAIIYTNECANHEIKEVPVDFDLISVDVYAGYTPGSKGEDEVVAAKNMYNNILFPKLHPHQQVMLVPGVFACSNLTYFPLDDQAANLVAKLEGYFEWAKEEPRIAGFNPWHFNNRSSPQHGLPCDMELGAVAMPSVLAKVQEIGRFIVNSSKFLP